MKEVVLRIPEEVHLAIGPGKDLAGELLKRIAVALYAEKKISMGKAVELSGLTYDRFMDLLGEVGIDINYDVEDFAEDMKVIEELERDGCHRK